MQRGGGCLDEVRRVAVGQQSSGAEGKRPPAAVQTGGRRHGLRVRLEHGGLLGLLVLAGHLPVAGLDALFLHGEGPVDLWEGGEGGAVKPPRRSCAAAFAKAQTHVVQLEVEAAGVAHRLPAGVAPPQRGGAGVAVGAERPGPLADDLGQGAEVIHAAGVNSNLAAFGRPPTSLFFGRISGLFWPFILWYSPHALHR